MQKSERVMLLSGATGRYQPILVKIIVNAKITTVGKVTLSSRGKNIVRYAWPKVGMDMKIAHSTQIQKEQRAPENPTC